MVNPRQLSSSTCCIRKARAWLPSTSKVSPPASSCTVSWAPASSRIARSTRMLALYAWGEKAEPVPRKVTSTDETVTNVEYSANDEYPGESAAHAVVARSWLSLQDRS